VQPHQVQFSKKTCANPIFITKRLPKN